MKAEGKRAAIDIDAMAEKSLDEISAADFLAALDSGGLNFSHFRTTWPEKKKVELWTEPEHFGKVHLGDILVIIKQEKKKYEIEKDPSWELHKRVGSENFIDPRQLLRDPEIITAIAREVAAQLRSGMKVDHGVGFPLYCCRQGRQRQTCGSCDALTAQRQHTCD